MRMFKKYVLTVFFLVFGLTSNAQVSEKLSLNGYVTNMQSAIIMDKMSNDWIMDNLLHNRLNFHFYPVSGVSGTIQMRNRLMFGETNEMNPNYGEQLDADNGWVDLTTTLFEEKSFLFNTTLDRLWLAFEHNNLNVKIGRQRINWGQTMVWNPNDIFNAYSFFDVDYPEKPGSDAIRIQYYTGFASAVEAAVKVNNDGKITAAGLVKFNKWNYDMQALVSILNEEDYGFGFGWSGYLGGASFRGETSYFRPIKHFGDTTGLFMASLGADYTFENSLMLQSEFLYCQLPDNQNITNFVDYYNRTLSVKDLSFTEYNIFVQASYPATPLLNVTLSAMYYPKIHGFFIGPNISYSLSDNTEASIIAQGFNGEFPDETGVERKQTIVLGFIRLKANF